VDGSELQTFSSRHNHKVLFFNNCLLTPAKDQTTFSFCAEHGKFTMIKPLIDTGMVDLDARDDRLRTSLSWAATFSMLGNF
jgi:hypothetical protein